MVQHADIDHTGLTGVGGSGGGLLAVKSYRPGSDSTVYTLTTTPALADATNLIVPFTAPASTNVLVRFTGAANMAATNAVQYWALWEGGALIGTNTSIITGANVFGQFTAVFRVAGISAGAHTYQWAAYKTGANAALLSAGPTYGALTMEVWEAP